MPTITPLALTHWSSNFSVFKQSGFMNAATNEWQSLAAGYNLPSEFVNVITGG